MSQELIGIIIATIALAGLILSGQRATRREIAGLNALMDKIESRIAQLEHRMARPERAGMQEGHPPPFHHRCEGVA